MISVIIKLEFATQKAWRETKFPFAQNFDPLLLKNFPYCEFDINNLLEFQQNFLYGIILFVIIDSLNRRKGKVTIFSRLLS